MTTMIKRAREKALALSRCPACRSGFLVIEDADTVVVYTPAQFIVGTSVLEERRVTRRVAACVECEYIEEV